MKLQYVILPLLLPVLLSGCGGLGKVVNPYEENFKCRTRDDAGKCIDTPSAYYPPIPHPIVQCVPLPPSALRLIDVPYPTML